jgi:hypothetical protein
MFFKDEPTKENESINVSLSSRQASLLLAAGLLVLFFSFITGYFWGKQNAVSQFCMSVEQSSFADRIYTSMCEIAETEVPITSDTVATNDEQVAEVVVEPKIEELVKPDADAIPLVASVAQESVVAQPTVSHYAQLAGYGTPQQAEKFAQKLRKKGLSVKVETRKSKSSKGKAKSWYQVVTKDFTDKKELETLVARISKEEKLSGVRIIRS